MALYDAGAYSPDSILGVRTRARRAHPDRFSVGRSGRLHRLVRSRFAFILRRRCVATLGATVAGVSFHLVALFTALLAFLVLREPVQPFHIVGIVLILLGFFVTLAKRRTRQGAIA